MIVPRYVSTFQPIRTAVGDLGFSNVMQTMEEDLVRWAIEAQDYITRKSPHNVMKMESKTLIIRGNKILYCANMQVIDCVKINGVIYEYNGKNTCYVTSGCACSCEVTDRTFSADGCYLRFTGQEDGTEVEVKYLARPMDENGYPMVVESIVFAIQEYIKWKMCFKMRDNRSSACEQRWYVLCRQARPVFNNLTQTDIEKIGYYFISKPRTGALGYIGGAYN